MKTTQPLNNSTVFSQLLNNSTEHSRLLSQTCIDERHALPQRSCCGLTGYAVLSHSRSRHNHPHLSRHLSALICDEKRNYSTVFLSSTVISHDSVPSPTQQLNKSTEHSRLLSRTCIDESHALPQRSCCGLTGYAALSHSRSRHNHPHLSQPLSALICDEKRNY